ncbi:MNIO family bufferin maturase [Stagnihabitans tardus]|uniref:DUF692 family protein n=1 Tax=Stagnihabitans tardus TaxID=2699202 RepID=A0AAE4Y7P5_9RHOB|nr:DUF692 domain-containing protein [Stagnihabitans tardus]NBZ86351.1 DUF692 family protein [Stagnihabitans tardus]
MSLPPAIGLGLKPAHYEVILETRPDLGFFEIHAENYMGAGGPPHAWLERIAALYPLSLHGVGLSIGGESLDPAHLARLRRLVDRYKPAEFSEHLAWSSHGVFFNDLLPLPYTEATLARICSHIDQVQDALGRRMLLENPSTYVTFAESRIEETDFLREIVRRTGCGLLLDVNNVMVSCTNQEIDPWAYLDRFPMEAVGELHMAGHDEDDGVLIDAHASPATPGVLALYDRVLAQTGPMATLIEWDNDVPDFPTLMAEAARVARHLGAHAEAA